MRAGCSLQTANRDGELPLHVAAVRGNYNIVQFLAENGADLDATDNVSTFSEVLVVILHIEVNTVFNSLILWV